MNINTNQITRELEDEAYETVKDILSDKGLYSLDIQNPSGFFSNYVESYNEEELTESFNESFEYSLEQENETVTEFTDNFVDSIRELNITFKVVS